MTKLIGYIKLEIIKRFSDRNIWIIFVHFKYSCKNCTLCRTISIKEFITLRRFHRNKLLSAYGKILQALAAHFHCKLSSHLCGHKGMGNAILFKITLKCNEIKADFFRNNVKLLHRLQLHCKYPSWKHQNQRTHRQLFWSCDLHGNTFCTSGRMQ